MEEILKEQGMPPVQSMTGSVLGGLSSAVYYTLGTLWHSVSDLFFSDVAKKGHREPKSIQSIDDQDYHWQDNHLLAKQIRGALQFLNGRSSLIAKGAMTLIQSGRIKIAHFKHVTDEDFEGLREVDSKGSHLRKTPDHAPLRDVKAQTLEKKLSGAYCAPNRVYISSKLASRKAIAETLVHELSHYLYDHKGKECAYDEFMDEMRAFLVEEIILDKPIRRSTVKWIYEHVKKSYPGLEAPPKATLPDEIFMPFLKL